MSTPNQCLSEEEMGFPFLPVPEENGPAVLPGSSLQRRHKVEGCWPAPCSFLFPAYDAITVLKVGPAVFA